jgi:site-specific recombinase XerD
VPAVTTLAPRTLDAYRADLRDFERWCRAQRRRTRPATPATVLDYVRMLAAGGSAPSTIGRRLAAIAKAHQALSPPRDPTKDPAVRRLLAELRRTGDDADRAAPLTLDLLHQVLAALGGTLAGDRDRALLLTGFWGALRRGELTALHLRDLDVTAGGIIATIPGSRSERVALPNRDAADCPAAALERWLGRAGITGGPVFRAVNRAGRVSPDPLNPESVSRRVKALVGLVRPDDAGEFSAHSLRCGFIASARAAGADEYRVLRHTRDHRVSRPSPADDPWSGHPAELMW